MAVIISRFCYAFLGDEGKNNYYCKADENYYSYDEMLSSIRKGNKKEDFIEIPVANFNKIIHKFFQINNVNHYRKKKISDMSDMELRRICHMYCAENGLAKLWVEYERLELYTLAVKWCEESGIPYTMKSFQSNFRN